jgi:hypothetical protein
LGQQSVDLKFMLNASEVQADSRKTKVVPESELKSDAKTDPHLHSDEFETPIHSAEPVSPKNEAEVDDFFETLRGRD